MNALFSRVMNLLFMSVLILGGSSSIAFAETSTQLSVSAGPNDPQHGFSDFELLPALPPDNPDDPDSHQTAPLPDASLSIEESPKGLFREITLAEGFEEDLEFRRGHLIYPVRPTDVFHQDALAVFVVFRVHKHYAGYQVIGRLYPEKVEELDPTQWIDEDIMYLALEDESGYLKLFPPDEGWKPGQYRVEIYVGYEVNPVNRMGTMRFTMKPQS